MGGHLRPGACAKRLGLSLPDKKKFSSDAPSKVGGYVTPAGLPLTVSAKAIGGSLAHGWESAETAAMEVGGGTFSPSPSTETIQHAPRSADSTINGTWALKP